MATCWGVFGAVIRLEESFLNRGLAYGSVFLSLKYRTVSIKALQLIGARVESDVFYYSEVIRIHRLFHARRKAFLWFCLFDNPRRIQRCGIRIISNLKFFMPTYIYETIPQKKGEQPEQFELQHSMKEAALTAHPETGVPVRRLISGGLGFTGSSKQEAGGGLSHSCGQGCGCG